MGGIVLMGGIGMLLYRAHREGRSDTVIDATLVRCIERHDREYAEMQPRRVWKGQVDTNYVICVDITHWTGRGVDALPRWPTIRTNVTYICYLQEPRWWPMSMSYVLVRVSESGWPLLPPVGYVPCAEDLR
jgi:hypothetical protein